MEMKDLLRDLNKLNKLIPYLFIIFIYFFLINHEEMKNNKINRRINSVDSDLNVENGNVYKADKLLEIESMRIAIPVLPFKEQ